MFGAKQREGVFHGRHDTRDVDQRDVRFGQQADRSRRLRAGQQHERAGFGNGAETAGNPYFLVARSKTLSHGRVPAQPLEVSPGL